MNCPKKANILNFKLYFRLYKRPTKQSKEQQHFFRMSFLNLSWHLVVELTISVSELVHTNLNE